MQRLRSAEHSGERLQRHTNDVVVRLLRRERNAGGLGVGAHEKGALVRWVVAALDLPCPDAPGRAELRDLLEEIVMHVEEEREMRHEVVDVESSRDPPLHVLEPIDESERELLQRGRPGFADVVAGDRDRVPARHLTRAVAERVHDETHRRLDGNDPLALRDVLLERVVLDRSPEPIERDAALVRSGEVHRPDDRRRAVDRHRGRHAIERYAVEEDLHVAQRVHGDALSPDLAARERVVRVAAHERRHIERHGETVDAVLQEVMEALVRVLRGAEPRELAHRPKTAPVHRRLHAPRVREFPGEAEIAVGVEPFKIVGRVERLDQLVGQRRKAILALGVLLRCGVVDVVEPALFLGPGLLDRHAASSERAITMRCISLVPS